ncbi:hypothetical protein AY606_12355 [Acinetobacter sp. SFB]|nr:hypothetical protein AY606_12355 [Acinetobacter sp. SFB]
MDSILFKAEILALLAIISFLSALVHKFYSFILVLLRLDLQELKFSKNLIKLMVIFMNKHTALEITQKLRSIYVHQVRVAELFLKIGEVTNLTPLILTGNKTVFSFKETGRSLTKVKKDISAVRSTSQADAVLAEIISELV